MKKIITILILTITASTQAQIAIGTEETSNSSVSLEFGTERRGLILPYVEDKSGINAEGTILYDTDDNTVKYLKDGGTWVPLTGDDGLPSTIGHVDLSLQGFDKTEQLTAKVGIGEPTLTDGILVLEDDDKAMVLPKVASPQEVIVNPAAGMIVYDTDSKMLAVFNGTAWSFWEP